MVEFIKYLFDFVFEWSDSMSGVLGIRMEFGLVLGCVIEGVVGGGSGNRVVCFE